MIRKFIIMIFTIVTIVSCASNSFTPFFVAVVDHWYKGDERPIEELALLRQPDQRSGYPTRIYLLSNGVVTTKPHLKMDAYLLPGDQEIVMQGLWMGVPAYQNSVVRFQAKAGHVYEVRINNFTFKNRSPLGVNADWSAKIVDIETGEEFR